MDQSTHASLLKRLAEGTDPLAWAEFHRRYRDLIRGFAGRYGLQPADCEDVTQEVCLKLSKSLSRFEYDPLKGRFRSYLRAIVTNTIFRKKRQERAACTLPDDVEDARYDAGSAMEAAWEGEWQMYHIRRAMRRLAKMTSERDRIAFTCYAMQGEPAERIASELKLTLEQVYQIKSRLLKKLSVLIAEQVDEEG